MATASTPTATPTLASLAAALHSADRAALARVFADLSEEALVLCEQAPSERLRQFWLTLAEDFQHEAGVALKAVTA